MVLARKAKSVVRTRRCCVSEKNGEELHEKNANGENSQENYSALSKMATLK